MEEQHADSGDYTFPGPVYDLRPFPAKAEERLVQLEARLAHLELIVHRYINQDSPPDDVEQEIIARG